MNYESEKNDINNGNAHLKLKNIQKRVRSLMELNTVKSALKV